MLGIAMGTPHRAFTLSRRGPTDNAIRAFGFVFDGDDDLSLEWDAGFRQFVAQAFRIDGFQKTGAGGSMHLDRQANDAFGQVSMVQHV